MLAAINAIQEYTKGMAFEEFVGDRKTVHAVVRNLIVLGEAVNNIPDEVFQKYVEIPWYEMRGMRNFVVHEYFPNMPFPA